MDSRLLTRINLIAVVATSIAMSAASCLPASAADKFKVTSVDCEMFFLWKHTPVLHYDIVVEREADYHVNPASDYFAQAAARTAEYCERTSSSPKQPLGPPRAIRGIWFQSNDGRFKALFGLDNNSLDMSAGVINAIGDRWSNMQNANAAHEAQLEAIRTREAREAQVKAAEADAVKRKAADEAKTAQAKAAAEAVREAAFFGRPELQRSRLGAEVAPGNFAMLADVRTNPFHYKKLGLAVVRTQFSRMVTEKVALFGNELAPILVHIDDIDRFTRSGETVMLAIRVIQRGEVEHSYGSIPDLILSSLKAEPLFGDYVGAYTCPEGDCNRIFDVPPA